jgi:hypothetical protein
MKLDPTTGQSWFTLKSVAPPEKEVYRGKAFSESGFLRKLSYRTSPATAAYRLIRVLTAATKLW